MAFVSIHGLEQAAALDRGFDHRHGDFVDVDALASDDADDFLDVRELAFQPGELAHIIGPGDRARANVCDFLNAASTR
jgi:hypothetical protein